MQHDRDEKYEGSDDTEYHFSDEEGGDYVDSDIPKETPHAPETETKPESGIKHLAPSKRMMISLVVFLGLVYVVYKMVAPTSQIPATEIQAPVTTAQAPTTQLKPTMPAVAGPQQINPQVNPQAVPTTVANAPQQQNMPMANTAPTQAPMAQQPMGAPMPSNVASPIVASTEAIAAAAQAATTGVVSAITQGQIMPVGQPPIRVDQQQSPSQPTMAQPVISQSPMQQQVMPNQPSQQPGMQGPMSMQQVMPNQPVMAQQRGQVQQVMPYQTQQQSAPMMQPTSQPAMTAMNPQVMPSMNAAGNEGKVVALANESDRLMNQLQVDYAQKLNDFSSQNKALQDEIQTLNSRIGTMETQINQLVQALTRQQSSSNEAPAPAPSEQQSSAEPRISYNVQAIIPGRAWLKSANGETLTVAEGDVIKSLGRVVKIDPYDGVVEINTGNKVVSLSYGTTA